MAGPVRHLFIASLGNPSPYTNTLHSAGHLVLSALPSRLSLPVSFSNSRGALTTSTPTSDPKSLSTKWTFYQCPSYMNISGPSVSKAFKQFQSGLSPQEKRRAVLVVVHDDLDSAVAKVKLRQGGSARGHNGIKSCIEALGSGSKDGTPFWRVSVGIGRPPGGSKDKNAVSDYVLGRVTSEVREKLETEAVDGCVKALRDIAKQEAGTRATKSNFVCRKALKIPI